VLHRCALHSGLCCLNLLQQLLHEDDVVLLVKVKLLPFVKQLSGDDRACIEGQEDMHICKK